MTKSLYIILLTVILSGSIALATGHSVRNASNNKLAGELQSLVDSVTGDIGIAVLSDVGDTILINNDERYPMMSVFKLHQAIATLQYIEQSGCSIDSIVTINRNDLNHSTWSPMLMEHSEEFISISWRDLLRYALTVSDNNASNYLFESLLNVRSVDSIICRIIPREQFRIEYTEAEMQHQHSRAFDNYTSPFGAALLIDKLYADSTLLSSDHKDFILSCLEECETGTDRIVRPLSARPGIKIGHKTGSGYRDNGILAAHNDVAFIKLPDDRHYVLAVFIKNFSGSENEASRAIAKISAIAYRSIAD